MPIDKFVLIAGIILSSMWLVRFYYKIFDKTIRKYVIGICALLVFWLGIRIVKMYTPPLQTIWWYLYYISIIGMPTLFCLLTRYLLGKDNKYTNSIISAISCILIILVITNDFHYYVFSKMTDNFEYTHQIGYFALCLWIGGLLLYSIANLVENRNKHEKDMKLSLVFIPMIIWLIYTALYVLNIPEGIRKTNMTVIIGFIFLSEIEMILKMDLVPNNVEYNRIFENSYLNIVILAKDGRQIYQTQKKIQIPQKIMDDIKQGKVEQEYKIRKKVMK